MKLQIVETLIYDSIVLSFAIILQENYGNNSYTYNNRITVEKEGTLIIMALRQRQKGGKNECKCKRVTGKEML